MHLKGQCPPTAPPDRLTDMHAIMEHCLAHGDEPLPQGVLAHASREQLDQVANMLEAGGFPADARMDGDGGACFRRRSASVRAPELGAFRPAMPRNGAHGPKPSFGR